MKSAVHLPEIFISPFTEVLKIIELRKQGTSEKFPYFMTMLANGYKNTSDKVMKDLR